MAISGDKFDCIICCAKLENDEVVMLTKKGLDTLKWYCEQKDDQHLAERIVEHEVSTESELPSVHVSCRKKYTDKKRLQVIQKPTDEGNEASKKVLRSSSVIFDFKKHCFFCGDFVDRNKTGNRTVATLEILDSLKERCDKRNDKWGLEVKGRLEPHSDLVAPEGAYHKKCYNSFCYVSSGKSVGRPENIIMSRAFDELCSWLESNAADAELYTLDELRHKLEIFADHCEDVWTTTYLQEKLVAKYADEIVVADRNGRKNVVCFQNTARRIINDTWYSQREEKSETESIRIVRTAAKLVKASIREFMYNNEEYPSDNIVADINKAKQWLPMLLQEFLGGVVCDELKQVAIGHTIVQAARPRSAVSPVLCGIGVSVDHVLGSKWMIQMLARLGFSISYDEVNKYKQSSLFESCSEDLNQNPNFFTQWAADNIDHNLCTLDGLNSVHVTGVIAMSTSLTGELPQGSFGTIGLRRMERVRVSELQRTNAIPIITYRSPDESPLTTFKFKPILELQFPYKLPESFNCDVLYHAGYFSHSSLSPRPNWSGFMQVISVGSHPPPANISMLPIIDLNSNDRNCIYSVLVFISKQAKAMNLPTPCVTFDQPLWQKAVEITLSESLNVVCRLGGFHLLMSFLGSIGSVMSGSGLEEALECCYGPNAVTHMLTGKAFARAVRGHFLTEAALMVHLMNLVVDSDNSESDFSQEDMDYLIKFYHAVEEKQVGFSESRCSEAMNKFISHLNNVKETLASRSRTAKLWLFYMDCVVTVKLFLRAERTGDWNLHLIAVERMLNVLAATGHNHYAKCARLYLQLMHDLPTSHPWLYEKFVNDNCHSVRRSDRFWAGLSTDLIIEQVMMRSIKDKGGLTHGRGMSESVRLLWIGSMHRCTSIHAALANLTGLDHVSDYDTKHLADLGDSRKHRDWDDLQKFVEFFTANNPFSDTDGRLCSITSGLASSNTDGVNCDDAFDVGAEIMKSMDNLAFSSVTMKKSAQIKSLSSLKNNECVKRKTYGIDSEALFSRLLILISRDDNIEPYFKFELAAEPTSLFVDSFFRKTDKSALAREILSESGDCKPQTTPQTFIVDGGFLLHKVKWLVSGTYGDVALQYCHYVKTHYGSDVIIVFDGYDTGASVKDPEHAMRAQKNKSAPDIVLSEEKPTYKNQAQFLSNEKNKKRFVKLLTTYLTQNGCKVKQAINDADTLIVDTAVKAASEKPVTVVATDTDVFIMLLYHMPKCVHDVCMQSETASSQRHQVTITSIRRVYNHLGGTVVKQLLFIHALSGCDTTSSMFGLGKATSYKKITRRGELASQIDVFGNLEASHSQITEAGMPVLAMLYGGNLTDSLDHLRYVQYLNLLATSSVRLRPERLPPTTNAAAYHLYRVHCQVAQWKCLSTSALDPLKWGWYAQSDKFWPMTTDLEAAPDDLRRIVKCSCKAGTDRSCVTQTCSCKRHGLPCIPACKHCHGVDCENRHEEIRSSFSNLGEEEESYLGYLDELGVEEEIVETA
jgi:hypothetical protein